MYDGRVSALSVTGRRSAGARRDAAYRAFHRLYRNVIARARHDGSTCAIFRLTAAKIWRSMSPKSTCVPYVALIDIHRHVKIIWRDARRHEVSCVINAMSICGGGADPCVNKLDRNKRSKLMAPWANRRREWRRITGSGEAPMEHPLAAKIAWHEGILA